MTQVGKGNILIHQLSHIGAHRVNGARKSSSKSSVRRIVIFVGVVLKDEMTKIILEVSD